MNVWFFCLFFLLAEYFISLIKPNVKLSVKLISTFSLCWNFFHNVRVTTMAWPSWSSMRHLYRLISLKVAFQLRTCKVCMFCVAGDKPHACELCHKKFALACNLRAHMKTHEGKSSAIHKSYLQTWVHKHRILDCPGDWILYGGSSVYNLLRFTLFESKILKWLLDCYKVCAPLPSAHLFWVGRKRSG
jgi:hypothetical protein